MRKQIKKILHLQLLVNSSNNNLFIFIKWKILVNFLDLLHLELGILLDNVTTMLLISILFQKEHYI